MTPKRKKNKKYQTPNFKEEYIIKFNYQKSDGFWVFGAEEAVIIDLNPDKEKDNHVAAEEKFLRSHPNVEIVCCTYV